MMEKKVIIVRAPNKYLRTGEVDVDDIYGVEWSNISGGVYQRQAGYSLYGYIDYELAVNLVDCSGRHSGYGSDARICIPAKLNKDMPYKDGYKYLTSFAKNAKPEGYLRNRRPGGIPCSRIIRHMIENRSFILRKDLRKELTSIGYETDTIRRALRHLQDSHVLVIGRVSSNYNNDIIQPL